MIPCPEYKRQQDWGKTDRMTEKDFFDIILDRPPCADKIWQYIIYVHNPYEPMPTIRELQQKFGFSKVALNNALNLLIAQNYLRAIGKAAWRKLYVNPGHIWIGSEQSRQLQIKKLDTMARTRPPKSQDDPPTPPRNKKGQPSNLKRRVALPSVSILEDGEIEISEEELARYVEVEDVSQSLL